MKVFCDIDGVLTDFPAAYNRRYNLSIPLEQFNEEQFPTAVRCDDPQIIDADLDKDFWANLPWMPDGEIFLYLLERLFGFENIWLLSFPSYSTDGPRGKIEWVRRELPQYFMRLILAMDKRSCASSDAILFDDKPRNVTEFKAAGGSAILVPAPWNHPNFNNVTMLQFLDSLERRKNFISEDFEESI